MVEGPDRGKAEPTSAGELAVGTGEANQLVLTDPTVSRHHFVIVPTPKGYHLRDTGSTNGTFVGVLLWGIQPIKKRAADNRPHFLLRTHQRLPRAADGIHGLDRRRLVREKKRLARHGRPVPGARIRPCGR